MVNAFKKFLILSHLEKKKRTEPFDPVAAETYELPADAGTDINNSHFFTASSMNETLSIRLGMRNCSEWEIFVLYRNGERFLVHEKDSYKASECPVKFRCIEVGKRWEVTFDGRLKDSASGEIRDAVIRVNFEAEFPIYDFLYHADRFNGMADAIAREKWNKEFFVQIRKNDQRHYEQPGRLRGTLAFGDESFPIDLCCVRDHSFGCREWDLMNDHIWLLGITGDNKVLSFSIVNYPRLKRIYSGYTNLFSEHLETLRGYEILSYGHNDGLGSPVLKLRCRFPGGNSVVITIKRDCNVKCLFGGGKYAFQEGLADFDFELERAGDKTSDNGGNSESATHEYGRGTLEYGFNQMRERWESYEN